MVEMQNFFLKIENRGHKSGALTVNWWARERRLAWKKGGHDRGTSPYPFPMWVPPPGLQYRISFEMLLQAGWSSSGSLIRDGVELSRDESLLWIRHSCEDKVSDIVVLDKGHKWFERGVKEAMSAGKPLIK